MQWTHSILISCDNPIATTKPLGKNCIIVCYRTIWCLRMVAYAHRVPLEWGWLPLTLMGGRAWSKTNARAQYALLLEYCNQVGCSNMFTFYYVPLLCSMIVVLTTNLFIKLYILGLGVYSMVLARVGYVYCIKSLWIRPLTPR